MPSPRRYRARTRSSGPDEARLAISVTELRHDRFRDFFIASPSAVRGANLDLVQGHSTSGRDCSEEDAVELTPELTGEMVMLESADAAICEAAQKGP